MQLSAEITGCGCDSPMLTATPYFQWHKVNFDPRPLQK